MSLTIRGNNSNFFFSTKTAKYSARRAKIEPKIDTFCSIGIRDLAILQVEKVVFWTLSKVFWSCLGRVYESIAVLRGPLFGVFPAPKVDKSPGKSSFLVKIDQLWPFWVVIFGNFGGQKSRFLDILKFFWGFLGRRVYASFSVLNGQIFGIRLAPKVDKWHQKSRFLFKIWPILNVLRCYFWVILGHKKLAILLGLKWPNFGFIFSSKGW